MRSRKYLIYGILVVLVVSIGVTYAYFTSNIENKNGKLSINSKEINIIFTDTTEISDLNITPGWSTSKSFSIENKSNDVFNYNIVLKDLINTFETTGNLQYKITSTNGYNMEDYADIPKSKEAKDIILAYDIDIEKDVKQEYTIEFIYKNSTEDQSVDMNKEFSGTLAITEGSIDPNKKYSVTIELENGTITSANPQETIKKGSLTYTYELSVGYEINETEVVCSGNAKGKITEDNIIISDIREDQICTVSPSKKTYIVDIKVNNGISDALNKHIEYLGSDTFNITPNYGYTLNNATVTGEGCSIEGSVVTVLNLTSNHTCEVTLKRDKYNVYLSGNNISVDESPKLVEYEGNTTFTVTPTTGYTLDNSVVNCDSEAVPTRTNNTITVSNITKETRCTITPVQLSYNVTLVMNNGSVSGLSTKTVNHGGSTTFNVSVNTGYNLTNPDITCTGSAVGSINGSVVTISNVTTEQTCTVSPKKNTYTLSIGTNNANMGTVSPSSSVIEHGNNVVVTINVNPGHRYVGNDCGGSVTGNTMIISNVTASRSCTVTFEPIIYTLTVNVNDASMGSVSPSPATTTYGGSYVVTVTPNPGYTYTTDCGVTPINNQLIWNNVTWDGACTVNFEPAKYTVHISDRFSVRYNQSGATIQGNTEPTYYTAGSPDTYCSEGMYGYGSPCVRDVPHGNLSLGYSWIAGLTPSVQICPAESDATVQVSTVCTRVNSKGNCISADLYLYLYNISSDVTVNLYGYDYEKIC